MKEYFIIAVWLVILYFLVLFGAYLLGCLTYYILGIEHIEGLNDFGVKLFIGWVELLIIKEK